jgi:uncharacterized lipoprotein
LDQKELKKEQPKPAPVVTDWADVYDKFDSYGDQSTKSPVSLSAVKPSKSHFHKVHITKMKNADSSD